jgi:hypothetical protein
VNGKLRNEYGATNTAQRIQRNEYCGNDEQKQLTAAASHYAVS